MKVLFMLLSIAGLALTTNAQIVKTKIVNASSLESLDSLNLNFCSSFSLEINGLYPIGQPLPLS